MNVRTRLVRSNILLITTNVKMVKWEFMNGEKIHQEKTFLINKINDSLYFRKKYYLYSNLVDTTNTTTYS